MQVERRTCEVCGAQTLNFAFTAKDRNRNVDEREFSILQCSVCRVGLTEPKLSAGELSRYYPREYYSLDTNVQLEAATRPYNELRIKRIQRYINKGTLLDIGAGTGMFLKTAAANGFDAEGLEISDEAAAFGRRYWNLNIRQGDLLETDLPLNHYDVVTLGHVFEHLHEPNRALAQLSAVLRQNGLLVIAVPNFASVQARLLRSRWFHLDVPRHLFHYSPQALQQLVTRAGFRVVEINHFSPEHNWAGILGSVMRLSRPGESVLHKTVRKLIGVPVAKSLAVVESAFGFGGTFEVYARKQ